MYELRGNMTPTVAIDRCACGRDFADRVYRLEQYDECPTCQPRVTQSRRDYMRQWQQAHKAKPTQARGAAMKLATRKFLAILKARKEGG